MATEVCCVCRNGAPHPLLVCMTCADGVDRDGVTCPVIYCSTKCMDADAETHSRLCSDKIIRKQLYRAGGLLQDVFYAWRRFTLLMNVVTKGEKKEDGKLHFKVHPQAVSENSYRLLFDFPSHLIVDPKDQAAVLSLYACTTGQICFYELSKEWLQDVTKTIEEAEAPVKSGAQAIVSHVRTESGVYVAPPGPSAHQFLTAEAKDGQAYVIDIAGAQLNQHQAVVPFDKYIKSMDLVRYINSLDYHGFLAGWAKDVLEGKKSSSMDFPTMRLHDESRKVLLASVAAWEKQHHITVRQMLQQPGFERRKDSLLDHITADLKDFNLQWKKFVIKSRPRIGKPHADGELCTVPAHTNPSLPRSQAYWHWRAAQEALRNWDKKAKSSDA